MTNLSNHPRVYRASESQKQVMSGGPTLSTAMSPDNAALDRVAAEGHAVIGRAPAVLNPKGGTLPNSSLTADALANAADSAARAKAAGVSIPTRNQEMAAAAGACPTCAKPKTKRARKRLEV